MVSVNEVLKKLKAKAKPDNVKGMARYGIVAEQRLGVSVPDIRKIAKELKKDHKLHACTISLHSSYGRQVYPKQGS